MKQYFLMSLLVFFCISMKATECIERVFKENKITLYLCQNYSNYNKTTCLLFKERTKVLSAYINEKIKEGVLQDNKFEIQIYDEVLTTHHLNLSKGKNGYFVNLSGFPTIQQLISIVDYFSKPNWKPFSTSDYQKVDDKVISNQIRNFYKSNMSLSNQTFIPSTVWSKYAIHLDYINDSLKYFIGDFPLNIKANSSLPVKIKDRFLFFQNNMIFVLQEQSIIKSFKIDQPLNSDYDIYVYEDWINICDGGKENWVYSYSYSKNKFFKRPSINK